MLAGSSLASENRQLSKDRSKPAQASEPGQLTSPVDKYCLPWKGKAAALMANQVCTRLLRISLLVLRGYSQVKRVAGMLD